MRHLPRLAYVICFWAFSAHALTVNRLNGGANVIYVDFSIPGSVVPLELARSYNSITALNEQSAWYGAFGWGWTAPFETTLTLTAERHVLLRDGSTGNTVIFKPTNEDPKVREAFFESLRKAYFERTKGRKFSDSELAKMSLPEKMLARLKTDPRFRAEMAAKYQVKGEIPKGEMLVSSEFGYQTIQFKNNLWVREKDGVTQFFDGEGRLVRQTDKNGFYFTYKYSTTNKMQLDEVSDQDHSMTLKFTWKQDKVAEVADNRNSHARYAYDGIGNLTQVTDSNGQTYFYKYENKKFPHLLTLIEYPSESNPKEKAQRELRYDDNGLVVYHRDKDGAETNYTYGKSPSDPENDFWTRSVRKTKVGSEETYDEYQIKQRNDGSRYLYKQENRQGGATTVTLFSSCCGKPLQLTRNGEVTNYKYYDNGLLKERVGPKEDVHVEYDPRWKKVSKVSQNGFVSQYEYDERGNLVRASNSRQDKVSLKYDRFGRILEMTDREGKKIAFQYGEKGKPSVITEKGVGTIRIDYDNEGRIRKTETLTAESGHGKGDRKPSEAKSQEVVRRVMKGFQQLLDIIRPAGVGMSTTT